MFPTVESRLFISRLISLRCGHVIPCHLSSTYVRQTENEEELPRITCPPKMIQKLEKRKEQKFVKEQAQRRQNKKGPLIISCKRKEYNFYQGETFSDFDVKQLVSCGWKNRKRVGDSFTLVPHAENPSLQTGFENCTFEDLGISERICSGLLELGINKPTAIQKFAIPILLKGHNVICAAETGSGKTLAYLLPALHRVLQHKHALWENSSQQDPIVHTINSPSSVIITPNRELTAQVMHVAESLTPYADFTPYSISGGERTQSLLRRRDGNPMDMLVTTPGVLRKLLSAKIIHGTNLQNLVIDESDTLLDDSFISDMHDIFRLFQVSPVEDVEEVDKEFPFLAGTQIVLASATMPRNVKQALGSILPVDLMKEVATQGLHQLQPHVPQKFIRLNPASKPEKLIALVKKDEEKQQPTLVFVNNNKTCYFIERLLEENGVQCLRLAGDVSQKERKGVYEKFKDGYCNVLVATDIASRGLDTTNVHHVINYDFPTFMSDYIHRVGRVGRVGVKHAGHVTSFVTHPWDVELLWNIEIAARKMKKLDNVNANIKQKLNSAQMTENELDLI